MHKTKLNGMVVLVFSLLTLAFAARVFTGQGYRLVYKMNKGDTLKYSQSSEMEQVQEMMGTEQKVGSTSDTAIKLVCENRGANGDLTLVMTYESFKVAVTSAVLDSTFDNPGGIVGKRVKKFVRPNGDQIKSVELDSIKILPVNRGFSSEQEFLPNLPDEALEMGKPVTRSDVDTSHTLGGTTVVTSEVQYTLLGKEAKAGYDCVKLGLKGTVDIDGSGKLPQGFELFFEGDGSIEGTIYFAPKEGILVSSENKTDIEMTAALKGQQNMTIPITQSVKSTLNLIK
ncbi:MAG: hypothetical protein D6743_17805 [Calditrichaeota bacterium]|nr:MAG: hypothetical protein D6743_17805 [Calditrichota bacterium]